MEIRKEWKISPDCNNILDRNISTIRDNTEVELEANKKVGPEVNAEKIKLYGYVSSPE
jgi:hypothetical protein